MMTFRRIVWALALAGMLLASAGCSGDSAQSADDNTPPVLVWDQQRWDNALWD